MVRNQGGKKLLRRQCSSGAVAVVVMVAVAAAVAVAVALAVALAVAIAVAVAVVIAVTVAVAIAVAVLAVLLSRPLEVPGAEVALPHCSLLHFPPPRTRSAPLLCCLPLLQCPLLYLPLRPVLLIQHPFLPHPFLPHPFLLLHSILGLTLSPPQFLCYELLLCLPFPFHLLISAVPPFIVALIVPLVVLSRNGAPRPKSRSA